MDFGFLKLKSRFLVNIIQLKIKKVMTEAVKNFIIIFLIDYILNYLMLTRKLYENYFSIIKSQKTLKLQ